MYATYTNKSVEKIFNYMQKGLWSLTYNDLYLSWEITTIKWNTAVTIYTVTSTANDSNVK